MCRGGILVVPPFAEELNKSRRVISCTARRLAAHGWFVLQIDLHGCGDSAGDFADARWQTWRADVALAAKWFAARNIRLSWLWGIRLGAILATDALPQQAMPPGLLFWQPVTSGKQYLAQFLRLKATERRLAQDGDATTTASLRAQLAAGETLEIGGYLLHPELAHAIEAATLAVPAGYRGEICWIEIADAEGRALSPAAQATIERLQAQGCRLQTRTVSAAAFWQAVEIEDCPALTESTVRMLAAAHPEDAR